MDVTAGHELPVSKEERIKLALSYIKEQYGGDDPNLMCVDNNNSKANGIKATKYDKAQGGPTIRQIAMYFKIPKSTLYDRMKAYRGQKRQRAPTRMRARTRTQTQAQAQAQTQAQVPGIPINLSSIKKQQQQFEEMDPIQKEFTHTSQMKYSPEMELLIVRNIQGYVMAYGNLPLISDLRECISLITRTKTFGNKWISGFIRRHADEPIYGNTGTTVPNATFKDFKLWKNKQSQLNTIFLQQLQKRLCICDRFQYLCLYEIRQADPATGVKHVILALDVKILETDSGKKDVSVELLCDPVVVDIGAVALPNLDSTSHPGHPGDPLLHLLHSVLKYIPAEETQLIILEGLTHLEHWRWSQCIELVTKYKLNNKLFAVPWGNHILAKSLQYSLQDTLLSKVTSSQLSPTSRILKELVNNSTNNSQLHQQRRNHQNHQNHQNHHQHRLVDPKDALQKLLDTICKNESRLYRELHNPESRITLCDIFNQVRVISESLSSSSSSSSSS